MSDHGTTSSVRSVLGIIEELKEPIEELLEQQRPPVTHPTTEKILDWIHLLVMALMSFIDTIALDYGRRLRNIENPSHISSAAPTISQPSAQPATEDQSQRTSSNRLKRCTKCHARGHDISDCRTANPSAMRKRVATNSRLAKQARANSVIAMPTIPPQAPPLTSLPLPPASSFSQLQYANLVADATELRRRSAQSARDRRSNRRRTSS